MSEGISANLERRIYAVWDSRLLQEAEPRSGILILADTGVAFQGLLKAAQQCFPNLEVTLSRQLPEEGDEPQPLIILVQVTAFRNIASVVGRCREACPGTPIALMVEDPWADLPGLRAVIGEGAVQGLLPSSMDIKVWLATVWLLINGGEYFPGGGAGRARTGQGLRLNRNGEDPGSGMTLSAREGQVLELMSEGLQNKLIAVKMDLSEHTVKVHVHNIIRKLKVHNRTQAAAVFRSLSQPSYGRAELR
jgi:DNA-binding NarL/FixJ family response regulator